MESFNEDFCVYLEYHLCRTFERSNNKTFKGYWCDGVSWHPTIDSHISKKHVNDTRMIETTAWIGKTGQEEFTLIIKFGKYSLRRYGQGFKPYWLYPR